MRAAALFLLTGLAVLSTLPAILGWGTKPHDPFLYQLGRRLALLAYGLLALQVPLAARLRIADHAFGLCGVMRLHRVIGICACLLSLSHAALILLVSRGDLPWNWPVMLGVTALLLLFLGVLAALLFRSLHVDYNRWRTVHKAMVLVVVLGYFHGRALGQDLLSSHTLRAWWTLLLAMALGVFIWRNVVVLRWGRRRFRVAALLPETHDTWTLKLISEGGRPLAYRPGQFIFLSLTSRGRRTEEHPFTISSSPTQGGFIAATIKEAGNFTRAIGSTQVGDRALVEGPFGRFSFVHFDAARFLFIAAGVGSSPIVSMLRFLRDAGDLRPVLFLYGNRTETDILFRRDLEQLPPNVSVIHVLSRPEPSWSGVRGHLDERTLRNVAGTFLDGTDVFLCGPPALLAQLKATLKQLGFPQQRIHSERFTVP